jgi:hypothetical protein
MTTNHPVASVSAETLPSGTCQAYHFESSFRTPGRRRWYNSHHRRYTNIKALDDFCFTTHIHGIIVHVNTRFGRKEGERASSVPGKQHRVASGNERDTE